MTVYVLYSAVTNSMYLTVQNKRASHRHAYTQCDMQQCTSSPKSSTCYEFTPGNSFTEFMYPLPIGHWSRVQYKMHELVQPN